MKQELIKNFLRYNDQIRHGISLPEDGPIFTNLIELKNDKGFITLMTKLATLANITNSKLSKENKKQYSSALFWMLRVMKDQYNYLIEQQFLKDRFEDEMHPHNTSKAQTPSTDYLQKCNHDDFKDFFHKKFKELTKNFPKIKPSRLPNVHDWLGIPSAQPDAMLVDILPLWESCQPNLSCCKKSTEKRQRTRKKETQNESPNIPKRKRRRPAGLDIEDALNILTEKLIKSINKPLSCKLKSS